MFEAEYAEDQIQSTNNANQQANLSSAWRGFS